MESELDKWEGLVKVLKKDFKETFSPTVMVGIVTSMLPQSMQELVYTSVGQVVDYDVVVQKIRAVVSNKVAMMSGPTPMDVGKIDCEGYDEWADQLLMDEDIGAVSLSTQCYGCGGWGHLRRDCPNSKCKGKGADKGKGKGPMSYQYRSEQNQSYGKTAFKGGNASSKGFQGS